PLERVVVSLFNMTEQNRLARLIAENKEQLARAQQSAALGQMSASIAHEIEQPLTAIQTSLDAATRWLRRDPIAVGEVNASIQTGLHAT
ncbi:histidine kinase dimerization/phospho-acceptor domain-containing protein, partial [Escherichia coli]|uniref:histidine kinase dimerization/phospho-acceptor domain-containing protein n=2 Tax=Pseudomonadota TaxID=1224 RepID=UPI003D35FD1D